MKTNFYSKIISRGSLIIVALLILMLIRLAFVVIGTGQLLDIETLAHSDYQCEKIGGAPGVEDIAIDPELGIAYISSLDDRRHGQRGVTAHGTIMAYSLDKPETLVDITPKTKYFQEQFHPQGFSFYRADDGSKYLFVINRRTDLQIVELFRFNGSMSLTHINTFQDPVLMTNPNNLVAVSRDQFYITNYRVSTSKVGRQLEQLLALPVSYVLYFDGKKFKKVATGIKYANGIEASKDGKKIYVASSTGNELLIYSRTLVNGKLQYDQSVELGTVPDNLFVDDQDNIWLAALPGIEFLLYRYEKVDISPSQVLKIVLSKKDEYVVHELYLNAGEELSASTSVGPYKNRMLLGGVYSEHFLDCKK
jgi:arylesterase/paraoxonase